MAKAIFEFILQPGCLRTCIACAPAHDMDERVGDKGNNMKAKLHKFRVCGIEKTEKQFSSSMWKNKSQRSAECEECEKKANMLHKCHVCGLEKAENQFSSSMWKNKSQQPAKCEECEEKDNMHKCGLCGKIKPRAAFSDSAWNNKAKTTRTVRCLDCSNPPCQAKNCTTCKVCRNAKCKPRKPCTKSIEPEDQMNLPRTHTDVLDFFCARCRYIKCKVRKSDGSFCSKERRKPTQKKAKDKCETYKCGECSTWLFSQEALIANQ